MPKRISQSRLDSKIGAGARARKLPSELAKESDSKMAEAIKSVSSDMRGVAATMLKSNANSEAVVNGLIAAMEVRITQLLLEMNKARAYRLVVNRYNDDKDEGIDYIEVVPKVIQH